MSTTPFLSGQSPHAIIVLLRGKIASHCFFARVLMFKRVHEKEEIFVFLLLKTACDIFITPLVQRIEESTFVQGAFIR
jgi:hypothetical protein